jgi:hypothetical protein
MSVLPSLADFAGGLPSDRDPAPSFRRIRHKDEKIGEKEARQNPRSPLDSSGFGKFSTQERCASTIENFPLK